MTSPRAMIVKRPNLSTTAELIEKVAKELL